jgi:hypothetical protein
MIRQIDKYFLTNTYRCQAACVLLQSALSYFDIQPGNIESTVAQNLLNISF